MDCSETRWLLAAALHSELDVHTLQELEHHTDACAPCARRLSFERRFETRLRAVAEQPQPDHLRASILSRLPRGRRLWPRLRKQVRPAAWFTAGALVASVTLLLGLQAPRTASPQSGDLVGTVVCLGCILRPESVAQHARDRGFDHVNALQDGSGEIWTLVDTREHRFRVEDAILGRRVRVRGTLDPRSHSIVPTSVEEETGPRAAAAPPPSEPGVPVYGSTAVRWATSIPGGPPPLRLALARADSGSVLELLP